MKIMLTNVGFEAEFSVIWDGLKSFNLKIS